MAGLKSCMVVFMMMTVASMQMHTSMAQTRHVVGDTLGWTIPSNGAAAYTAWAAQQNFTVGDTLVFNFATGAHNVARVSQAAYGPCTTANPTSITTTGPATITLTTPGPHYFICTVGTHCQIGQKLTINVSAAAAAPTTPPPAAAPTTPPPAATPATAPPAATPTPSPTSAPTPAATPTSSPAPSPVDQASPPSPPTSGPSPSGSTTPPPSGTPTPTGSTTPAPPSNAASSFTTVVPATFLAIGLALFY